MKGVIRVSAGILIEGSRVLIAKRGFGGSLGGMWEFPGGKIETGETVAECLSRELREELCIEVAGLSYFDTSFYEYGRKRVLLLAMIVNRYSGRIRPVEHEEIAWVETQRLLMWDLAPADVPFARRLQRLSLRGISPRGRPGGLRYRRIT